MSKTINKSLFILHNIYSASQIISLYYDGLHKVKTKRSGRYMYMYNYDLDLDFGHQGEVIIETPRIRNTTAAIKLLLKPRS